MIGMKIGIDFGSHSIKICSENKELLIDEPSVVAVDSETDKTIAFGSEAYEIYGRSVDDIKIVKVVNKGVIADFVMAERMLRYYLQKVCGNKIFKPNVMISLPSDVTDLERKTYIDAVTLAGAGRVCVVDGILASAFGANVSSDKIGGRMVIDIGHDVTEFCVVSLGNIAVKGTIRIGSGEIDKAIIKHLKRDRDIIIGPHTAKEIKHKITSALSRDTEVALMISGKSNLDDMPISFEVTSTEIFPFVDEQLNILIKAIKKEVSNIPPELVGDTSDHGIILCGGGALIFDIADVLGNELGIRCSVADDTLHSKIKGLNQLILDSALLESNGYSFIFKDEISDRIKRFNKKK